MAKLIFNAGAADFNGVGYGLIGLQVNKVPSKVDVSDTGENNQLLVGRQIWPFMATIIADDVKWVQTFAAPVRILLSMGSDHYIGDGILTNVQIAGKIDDKIIWTVRGEFEATAYHAKGTVNGVSWMDSDGNGIADSWTYTGSGSPSIELDNLFGRYQFLNDNGAVDYLNSPQGYISSATYVLFCRYDTDNLDGVEVQTIPGNSRVVLTNDTGGIPVETLTTFVAGGSDSVLRLHIEDYVTGDNHIKLYYLFCGKLIDSLT